MIILRAILKKITKEILKRYRPDIIILKNNTHLESIIFSVLAGFYSDKNKIKIIENNLDDELNLFFSIIGQKNFLRSIFFGFFKIISPIRLQYPNVLIFRFKNFSFSGIKTFLQIIKPNSIIISNIDELKEGIKFAESFSVKGCVIMNIDSINFSELKEKTRANILKYGINDAADVKISNIENIDITNKTKGTSFKIEYKGSFVPIILEKTQNEQYVYDVAAGFAIGITYDMNLVKIEELIRKS